MEFCVIGTSFKYIPLEQLEKFLLSKQGIYRGIRFFKSFGIVPLILSTCNRIEYYFTDISKNKIISILSRFYEDKLGTNWYFKQDLSALKHLVQVSCGIDSMFTGEKDILGQIRNVFNLYINVYAGKDKKKIIKFFNCAFKVTRKVRRVSGLDENPITIGKLIYHFLQEHINDVNLPVSILFVGTGNVVKETLELLQKENSLHKIFIASSKHPERSKMLAEKYEGKPCTIEEVKKLLPLVDIGIFATGSPHTIIKKSDLNISTEHHLKILDVSVPRDVGKDVKELGNVTLYTIEDLKILSQRFIDKELLTNIKSLIESEVRKVWDQLGLAHVKVN